MASEEEAGKLVTGTIHPAGSAVHWLEETVKGKPMSHSDAQGEVGETKAQV